MGWFKTLTGGVIGGLTGGWAGALAGLASGYGADQQQSAAQEAANKINSAAVNANNAVTAAYAPYIAKENEYLNGTLLPAMTEENPYLKAEHEQSLGTIGRNTASQEKSAESYWGQYGNVGRGRGEAQRANKAGLESTLKENTDYGINTTSIQKQAAQEYYNALMGIGNQVGSIAEGNANRLYGANTSAAGITLNGANTSLNTMGTTIGSALSMWANKNYNDQLQDILTRYGINDTSSSSDGTVKTSVTDPSQLPAWLANIRLSSSSDPYKKYTR